jgi:hypothetical protein
MVPHQLPSTIEIFSVLGKTLTRQFPRYTAVAALILCATLAAVSE